MSTCITVATQQEVDAALAATERACIHIESERGVWIRVATTGPHTIRVQASATVEACDSATVEAWGSATVKAWGSATVEACDSATVEACDSATVEAWGTTHVAARGRSRVSARPYVAVHLHSAQAQVTGGLVIDVTQLDLNDPATWCEHHGVAVEEGRAVLYKAVDKDLAAGRGYILTTYPVGASVEATDWRDNNECGGGLHLSPRLEQAGSYEQGPADTRRYLRCTVALTDLRPIDATKCKVRALRVEAEVDAFRRVITPSAPTESAKVVNS